MTIPKLLLHNRNLKVVAELNNQNQDITDEDRRLKFEKMSVSPYIFFRGSNHLFWEDFYKDWRINFFGGIQETLTWINGDAHIYNYGAYADHNGKAIFCMDDFDDSIVADYQFDLWRMAVSIVLDCREQRVFNRKTQKKAVGIFARTYRERMSLSGHDEESNEKHLTAASSKGLMKKFLKKVEKEKNRQKMLSKWTTVVGDTRKFDLQNPKVKALDKELYTSIYQSLTAYIDTVSSDLTDNRARFRIKDIVGRGQAGTGSLGSERYYALLEGDTDANHDDVILDIKEQGKPPLYDHMNRNEQQEFDRLFPNPAQRHALAFQALAEHPDKYLGWFEWKGKFFSVKERSPFKADFPTEKLKDDSELYFMSELWGDVLARRHKRASYALNQNGHDMPEKFAELIDGNEEEFDKLVESIAFNYANCVKQDFQYFKKALKSND